MLFVPDVIYIYESIQYWIAAWQLELQHRVLISFFFHTVSYLCLWSYGLSFIYSWIIFFPLLLQTSVRRIKAKRMWRSHTSQPTFIHMKDPMSSTAQTKSVSHSVWPGGKILTTGNTHSSCHQSKSPCSSTVDLDRITIVWSNRSSNWGSTVGLSGQQAIYFGFCVCTVRLKAHYSVLCHAGRTTPLWTTLSMWARPAAPALSLWVFVWTSGCLPLCVSTLVRVRSSGGQMAWCPWQKPTPAEPFVAPDTSRPLLPACLYRPTPSASKRQSVSQKQTRFVHMHQINTRLTRFFPFSFRSVLVHQA